MKVIGLCLATEKSFIFGSVNEASERTGIQPGYIMRCIRTGMKWKLWCFDEVNDD
ncbi:MAG: hypothetical protein IKP60_07180 [Treponema sp.]|nr:hypothetical protein [Treponema sp.]